MILATDLEGNLGYGNDLIYSFKKDLKRFKELTSGITCIMGKNTWESLPFALPERKNIVLTSSLFMRGKIYSPYEKRPDGFVSSIDDILELAEKEDIFIIGGTRLYEEMFKFCDEVYHTVVHDVAEYSDTKIDDINKKIAEHFTSLESVKTTDVDRLSGKEMTIEFRTYKREFEL